MTDRPEHGGVWVCGINMPIELRLLDGTSKSVRIFVVAEPRPSHPFRSDPRELLGSTELLHASLARDECTMFPVSERVARPRETVRLDFSPL